MPEESAVEECVPQKSEFKLFKLMLESAVVVIAFVAFCVSVWNAHSASTQVSLAATQIATAQKQSELAQEQNKIAQEQNRVTDIERFRDHMRRLANAVNPPIDQKHESPVGPIAQISNHEIGRSDGKVKFERVIGFVVTTSASKSIMDSVEGTIAGPLRSASDVARYVEAVTNFEAAVRLEKENSDDVLSMEYVMLATYAYSLSGIGEAEAYINKATEKIKESKPGWQRAMLNMTIGNMYYMNHPRWAASEGAVFFSQAKDLYRDLPEKDKSATLEYQIWIAWAEAEYSIGNETNGQQYEKEGWSIIQQLPLSQGARDQVLIGVAKTLQEARTTGRLNPKNEYSLGVFEMTVEEFDRPWNEVPNAPTISQEV